MMRGKRKLIFIAPLALLGILALMAIGGYGVMLLWNWLVPALFSGPTVTFWQALGVLVLCRVLFGRWGGSRRGCGGSRMRQRMEERWNMTPEERERMREEMRRRWGFGGPQSGSASGEPGKL